MVSFPIQSIAFDKRKAFLIPTHAEIGLPIFYGLEPFAGGMGKANKAPAV
jgi:hypothetical protein